MLGSGIAGLFAARRDFFALLAQGKSYAIGGERLSADLVVDASGRNAPSVQWLMTLGFEAPAESVAP